MPMFGEKLQTKHFDVGKAKYNYGWSRKGIDEGWYEDGKFPTAEASDRYKKKVTTAGVLLLADLVVLGGTGALLFSGLWAGGIALGVVPAGLWVGAKQRNREAKRHEEALQAASIGSGNQSMWSLVADTDFTSTYLRNRQSSMGITTDTGPGILSAWLNDCNLYHQCKPDLKEELPPSRLIFVGLTGSTARLSTGHNAEYVALSHCWGSKGPFEFKTTQRNVAQRGVGFRIHELPQLFQDAIRVTRWLGKSYLWIDSICIVQDDLEDWNKEAQKMAKVYASAYCTITADSSQGSHEGFLNKSMHSGNWESKNDHQSSFDSVAEFETCVNRSHLNSRAWVLQERILSPRTIHFTGEKIYWDCGLLTRCSDLTRLECAPGKDFFVQDPAFPQRLHSAGVDRAVDFLQFIFSEYSRRGLTNPTDRKKAINGIISSMQLGFNDEGPFGVFNFGLHRLLLWYRPEPSTPRISYGNGDNVPSWSWMTYPGEVMFEVKVDCQLHPARGKDLYLCSHGRILKAKVRSLQNCEIGHRGLVYAESRQVGTLRFDTHDYTSCNNVVVIARTGGKTLTPEDTAWVLLVREDFQLEGYRRIGIGEVKVRYINELGKKDSEIK